MGHLEPSAAAAGLASLALVPLSAMVVVTNTQLRRLARLFDGLDRTWSRALG